MILNDDATGGQALVQCTRAVLDHQFLIEQMLRHIHPMIHVSDEAIE